MTNPYGTPQQQAAWLLSEMERVDPRIAELGKRYPTAKVLVLDYLATIGLKEMAGLEEWRDYCREQLKGINNGQ